MPRKYQRISTEEALELYFALPSDTDDSDRDPDEGAEEEFCLIENQESSFWTSDLQPGTSTEPSSVHIVDQVARTVCLLALLAAGCGGAATGKMADREEAAPRHADKRLGLVSSLASASAGLSSSSSGSSSHSSDPDDGYGPPVEHHPHGKEFDLWTFKKELLRSVFQIVKALKGGLLALKGHIVKTKGQILETKGRLLAAKGEAIKDFGKSVAANAFESSHHHHHPSSSGYGAPSGYPASGHASSGYSSSGAGGSHLSYSGPPPPAGAHHSAHGASGFGGSFSSPAHLFPGADLARVAHTAAGSPPFKPLPEGASAGLLILKPVSLPAPKTRKDVVAAASDINLSLLPYPELLAGGNPYQL
ncbi:uncharacterized protein LOC134528246 [Bacillus rossius redtenbacheri]|uniref:uncharacterized protein LOC134528246 n=1 Tax=Bacillus rossius redtenbacheri TaxID=93214 RepID=UPI002FDEB4BC